MSTGFYKDQCCFLHHQVVTVTHLFLLHLLNCVLISSLPAHLPCFVHVTQPFPLCLPPRLSSVLPLSLLYSAKSSGHQSYVVSGSSEVHWLLHLAQLPLADPQGAGPDTAAAHAGPLPLLNPWLPCQEDAGGLMRW